MLLDHENNFPLLEQERHKLLHFLVVCFEQLWLQQNQIRLGSAPPKWEHLAAHILSLALA